MKKQLIALALLASAPAFAALQDVDGKAWNYDPATDLAWLDPSITAGTSFNQLAGGANTWGGLTGFTVASAGVSQTGWRYATSFEMQDMISTAPRNSLISILGGPTQGTSFSLLAGIYGLTFSNAPDSHAVFSLHGTPTGTGYSFAGVHSDSFVGDTRIGHWLVHDNGGSLVAPIPEPETYALMLAGLFAVAFVAKQRAARRAR